MYIYSYVLGKVYLLYNNCMSYLLNTLLQAHMYMHTYVLEHIKKSLHTDQILAFIDQSLKRTNRLIGPNY